jgi:hypothetical protein
MSQTIITHGNLSSSPAKQAYELLRWGFVLALAVGGVDKFSRVLTNWDHYLAPSIARISLFPPRATMIAVGILEIGIAVLVAVRPRIGAYAAAAWLAAVVVNLVVGLEHLDVALADLGLLVGALALGRLAQVYDHSQVTETRTIETIVDDDGSPFAPAHAAKL